MRCLILLVFLFFLSSCKNYDINISELKKQKLYFKDLPVAVQKFLIQPPEFNNEHSSSLVIINPNEQNRYILEVVFNKWISSWVDYLKIIDEKNKVSYKVNQGIPSPFFIHEHKLYIPNKFNIFTTVDDFNKVEFTCYELK